MSAAALINIRLIYRENVTNVLTNDRSISATKVAEIDQSLVLSHSSLVADLKVNRDLFQGRYF